jgi:transcriptional regulator with XRE-family HTH domain
MHRTNLRTGRQLKAARALAGIKQEELARAAGLHVNSIRYMERKDRITDTWSTIERVVAALEGFGVVLSSNPAPGVYLNH